MSNVYYSPEDFGLIVVADLELSEPDYSFDTVVVWRHPESGLFYWAHDSGCSCPTPFEDYRTLEDLSLVFSDTFDELRRYVAHSYNANIRASFLRKVRSELRKWQ